MSESEDRRGVLVTEDFRGNAMVPLPLGRPRALTVGLLGEDGVEGSTEDRKLEAGDGGTEVKGEEVSE